MTTAGSANGKNSTRRIACATVLWLLVAIFANQGYVLCAGEDARPQMLQPQPPQQPLSFLSQQPQQQPPSLQQSPSQTQQPTQFGTSLPQQSQFGTSLPQQSQFGGGPIKGPQQQDINPTPGPNLNKQISIQSEGPSLSPPAVDYPQKQIMHQMPQMMQQQKPRPPIAYQGAQSFQMPGNGYSFQSSNTGDNQNPMQLVQSLPQRLGNALPIEQTMNLLDPMPYAQQGMGMASNTLGKFRDYSTGVKNGVGSVMLDVGNKLLDGGQSLVHGVANLATAIPDTIFDMKRKGIDTIANLFNIPQPARNSVGYGSNSYNPYNPSSNVPPNYSNDNYGTQMGQGYPNQMQMGGNYQNQPPQMGGNYQNPSQMGGNYPNQPPQMGGNYQNPSQMGNQFRPIPIQSGQYQYPQAGGYANPSQMGSNYGNPSSQMGPNYSNQAQMGGNYPPQMANQYRPLTVPTGNQYLPSAAGGGQFSMGGNSGQRQDYYPGYPPSQQQQQTGPRQNPVNEPQSITRYTSG